MTIIKLITFTNKKSLGKLIPNPNQNKNNSEIFANSLIYNSSSRYELNQFNINGSVAFTLSKIDNSSLKVGDRVEFLERNTEISVSSLNNVEIISIDKQNLILKVICNKSI